MRPGEMADFGETSEQECDKNNSSPPTSLAEGVQMEKTGPRVGERTERDGSLQTGQHSKSEVWSEKAEAPLIQTGATNH